MTGLWIEVYSGDKDSCEAYNAFLDCSGGFFPLLTDSAMDKLVKYNLALRRDEDGECWIDPYKLDLWSENGSLGDGMKPIVRGL